jgi:3-dehydroquinate synthetase
MADAAIGGKTAVDLPQGKNLVGAFWPPSAVVADAKALATLPDRERSTGLAEIVKCAVIGDPGLLDVVDRLQIRAEPRAWKDVVAAAARVKVRIVAGDPRESGERAVLNLGHTVAHGLEASSGFALPHGAAVSVGLRAAGLLAKTKGWWPDADHARVLRSLQRAGLPLSAEGQTADAVMAAMAHDKKALDGRIRFVLPVRIGDVRHGIEVSGPEARAAVTAILAPPAAAEWSA